MKILKLILIGTASIILGALLLWISLAVGASDPHRYLALARASCFLCGSLGLLVGTMLARPKMTLSAVLLLVAGLASFYYRVG